MERFSELDLNSVGFSHTLALYFMCSLFRFVCSIGSLRSFFWVWIDGCDARLCALDSAVWLFGSSVLLPVPFFFFFFFLVIFLLLASVFFKVPNQLFSHLSGVSW